jgi:hypothetical protein
VWQIKTQRITYEQYHTQKSDIFEDQQQSALEAMANATRLTNN